jgi:hypothetical protein
MELLSNGRNSDPPSLREWTPSDSIPQGRESHCACVVHEVWPPVRKKLINVCHKFAQKRYAQEDLWQPSPKIKVAIWKAVFN